MAGDAVETLLPQIEGKWVPLLALFFEWGAFDAERFARGCEQVPVTLVRTAGDSFELRHSTTRDGQTFDITIRHDWMVGNTFDRGVEEGQAMAFLGLDPENLSPSVMTLSSMRGDVSLYHPL